MKEKKELLFAFSHIKAGNGGIASAIELAIALTKLNYNVSIIIYSYKFWGSMVPKRLIEKLSKSNIKIIKSPGFRTYLTRKNKSNAIFSSSDSDFFLSIQKIKIFLKECISLCFNKINKNNFLKLSTFDGIFFSEPLFGVELDCIRENSNAALIQNHAGSPENVEKNVLNNNYLPIHSNSALSLYVNFCLSFDHILFQASDQALECKRQHPLLEDKVKVLLPTCNENDINAVQSLNSPFDKDKKNIINVGSIQPRKDQLSSILAFEKIDKISNVQLHFVGDYNINKEYYQLLIKTIKSKGLESKVFFHGHRDDYLLFMNNADVLIQTSHSEGVSRVLREAMFMKLPIVSFDISGTSGILKKDDEAILVEDRNITKLGVELESIIFNKEKHKFISSNAFKKYLMNHSNEAYSHNLSLLFKDVLKNKQRFYE